MYLPLNHTSGLISNRVKQHLTELNSIEFSLIREIHDSGARTVENIRLSDVWL
jgi:hypothetical protein